MKYGQKVRVTSGFYEGMGGILIRKMYELYIVQFCMDIQIGMNSQQDVFQIEFEESNIEIIK